MKKQRIVFTPEMEQRLITMRSKGFTAKQVAKELGISDKTASKRMARLPRAPGAHQQLQVKLRREVFSLPAEAKIVMPAGIKVQRHISVLHDKAPICNATVRGLLYEGKELAYRR